MLDLFGIVVSTVMILLVVFRAVQLDAKGGWFQEVKVTPQEPDTKPGRAGARPVWSRAPRR